MTLDFKFHGTLQILVLVAATAACGPGKSGTTDTAGTTDTSTSSEPLTSTGTDTGTAGPTTNDTTPTTTGGVPTLCAEAKTEAECLAAIEMDEDRGLACRWAEVLRFAATDGADGCGFEPAGGVCVLAGFEAGGPGCAGFWREVGPGQIDFAMWDCGSPVADEWQGCFDIEVESPGFPACLCMNGGG